MKVAIYGQFYHANSGIFIEDLLDALECENFEVLIEEDFLKLIHQNESIKKEFSHLRLL